jgi:metal-dependent amidase/aminoacylase/carboxypeptidase family protein
VSTRAGDIVAWRRHLHANPEPSFEEHEIVARETSPMERVVVSVTQIHAGSAYNIIPEVVELRGTVRTFTHDARDAARAALERIATGIAGAHGCTAEVSYEEGYLALENDPGVAELVRRNVEPNRLREWSR